MLGKFFRYPESDNCSSGNPYPQPRPQHCDC